MPSAYRQHIFLVWVLFVSSNLFIAVDERCISNIRIYVQWSLLWVMHTKMHDNFIWICTHIFTVVCASFTPVKYHNKIVLYKKRTENSQCGQRYFSASLCIQGSYLRVAKMKTHGASLVVINALNIMLRIYTVSLCELSWTCFHINPLSMKP